MSIYQTRPRELGSGLPLFTEMPRGVLSRNTVPLQARRGPGCCTPACCKTLCFRLIRCGGRLFHHRWRRFVCRGRRLFCGRRRRGLFHRRWRLFCRRRRLFFGRRWGSRLARGGGRCFRGGRRSWRRGLTRTTTATTWCRRLARRLSRRRLVGSWGRGGGPFGCRRSRRGAGCWEDPRGGRPRIADPGACRCQACAHVLAPVLYALFV